MRCTSAKRGKLFAVAAVTMLISVSFIFSYNPGCDTNEIVLRNDFNDGTWIPISSSEDLSRIGSTGAAAGAFPLNGKYYLTDNIFFGTDDLNGGHELNVTGTISSAGTFMNVTVSNPGGSGSVWRIDTLHVRVDAIHASRTGTTNTSTVSLTIPQSDVKDVYTVTVAGFYRAGSSTNVPFAYTFLLDRSQPSFDITFNGNGNMNPIPAGFTGILDGNGHIISGMNIAIYTTSSSSIGLFTTTAGSTARIQNIGIIESSVTAVTSTRTLSAGGMIGTASAGTQIINSHFDGIVAAASTSGVLNAGGLIGNAPAGATKVIDSYNSAQVSARTNSEVGNAGGIIGVNGGSAQIINTFNTGSIASSTLARAVQSAGGIVGFAAASTTVTNCYNTGSVFTTSTSSAVYSGGITGRNGLISGSGNIGSIVAINTSDSGTSNASYAGGITGLTTRPITDCYNTGDVTSVSRLPFAGGIVGSASSAVTVTSSFNTGHVTAGGLDSNPARAGGIAGQTAGPITNCYNTGDITGENMTSGTSSSRTARAGGIAGETSNVIRNCYSTGTVAAYTGNSNVPLAGGIAGNVGASAARIANSYYLQNSVIVNGTILSQIVGGGNSTAISNIDGGTLVHNPVRAPNQMSSVAKTPEQMRPPIETAENNGSIFYTGTIGTGSSAIPGWDFSNTWTTAPNKNDGYPILQSKATILTIDEHPDDVYVNPGDTATFRVSASTGSVGLIRYQWQISEDHGETWSDIRGAVSDTFKIHNTAYETDDNLYRCAVSTVFGFEISEHAILSVSGAKKTIFGTVLHDDGVEEHPLPGVTINFTINDTQHGSVTTDGEGYYEITVPIFSNVVISSLQKIGYDLCDTSMNLVFPQIEEDHEENLFMIPDGSNTILHGMVTHNGHFLGDVKISYEIHIGDTPIGGGQVSSSTVSGMYAIPVPYGSVITITSVSKENYVYKDPLPSVYIHEMTEHDLIMAVDPNMIITINIAGIVSEFLNKTPLTGVTIGYIVYEANDPSSFSARSVVSDENGKFTLNGIPFGSDVIISEVTLEGYIRVGILPLIYAVGSADPLKVYMSPKENALSVSGTIKSESSEGPIPLSGVLISYRIDREEGFVLTDDSGHYMIGVFSGQHVEIVSVTKEGFIIDETAGIPFIIVMEGDNKEYNFTMVPVSTVSFRITGNVTHDGNALPNVTIFYTIDDASDVFEVRTDAHGNYAITASAGQTVTITGAEKDGYVLMPVYQVPAAIFVQSDITKYLHMEPDGITEFTLSGVVMDGSKPIAGIEVEYGIDGGEIKSTITDGHGRYEIRAASGSYVTIISLNCGVYEEMPITFRMHTDKVQNFVMQTYGAGSVTITITPGKFDNGMIYWSMTGGNDLNDHFLFEGEISFMIGTEIHIWAIPDPDHEFLRWTGISAGLPEQTKISLFANSVIGAVFWKEEYTLTPVIDDLYTLYMTIGDGDEFEFIRSLKLPEGTQISIRTEFNVAGYNFSYWTGVGGIGNPFVFDLDGHCTIGAAFYKDTDIVHTLTPSSYNNGKMFITLGGMERVFDMPVTLLAETVVPITAAGNDGFGFSYWTGDLKGTIVRTSVVMNEDRMIGAVFYDYNEYFELVRDDTNGTPEAIIRWSADGVNFAEFTESIRFPVGTAITIVADGNLSYWVGDTGGNENPKEIVMDSDLTIGVVLYTASGYTITVTQHHHGQIYWQVFMIDDEDQIPLNAPSLLTGSEITVPVNTRISFEAVGIGSWEFENWFGGLVNTIDDTSGNYHLNDIIYVQASASVSISNRTLGAAFDTSAEYTLTPETASGGKIFILIPEMSVNEEFTHPITVKEGYTVTITATGDTGSTFSHWIGTGALTDSYEFRVSGDMVIGAVFYDENDEIYTLTPEISEKGNIFISIEGNEEVLFTIPVTLKAGTEVTLKAEGKNDYDLLHWIGIVAVSEIHTFTVFDDMTIGAVFYGGNDSIVTIMPGGTEGGETYFTYGDGSGQWIPFDNPVVVIAGTEISFKAVAAEGHVFSHWFGLITLDEVYTFRAHDDMTINAVFYNPKDPGSFFTITGSVTGSGEIRWAIADVHGMYMTLKDPITFANGITIYLRAHADGGWTFIKWSVTDDDGPYIHAGGSDLMIVAEFRMFTDINDIEIEGIEGSYVYTGEEIKPDVTVSLKSTGQPLVPGKDYVVGYKDNRNVGTAEVTITFIGDYYGNAIITFEITTAALTVTVDEGQHKVYGTDDPELTYTATGWKGSDEENASSLLIVILARDEGENTGTYAVFYEILSESGGNYTIYFVGSVFTITKASLTVTADTQFKIYGTDDPTFTYTVTGWQFNDEANENILGGSLARDAGINAGSYVIRQGTLTDTSGNYAIQFVQAVLTITKATLTVTADTQFKIYGTDDPTFTYTVTGWKFDDEANENILGGSLARDTGIDVGPYTIRQGTLVDASGNYLIHFVEAIFTITKATLTVTADDLAKVYGADDPIFTFTVTGWQFDDEMNEEKILSGALTREHGENVRTYGIKQGTLAETGGNYLIHFVEAIFTITKATLTITADTLTEVYGAGDPIFTFIVTGWQFDDEADENVLGGSLSRDTGIDVGQYTIRQGTLADASGNYLIHFVEAIFTITKTTLTVTADNIVKVYGSADPTFTYTVTGWQFNDEADENILGGSLARDAGINAGSYVIRQGTLVDTSGNYNINFVEAIFTITKATLTITADDLAKVYGADDPIFTFTASGWQLNDETDKSLTGALTREHGENTGSYVIRQGTLTDTSGNYEIHFVEAVFTIMKAALTVTADDFTKVYGAGDPIFTFTVTGWQFNDEANGDKILTGALTREQGENTGSYGISRGTLVDASGNYMIQFVEATFTITKATLTITADNIAKVYGAGDPIFTFTVTGWQFNDEANEKDILGGSLARDAGINAGSYIIHQGTLADTSGNYAIQFVEAIFTITKATLTVTADDLTKVYGADDPALTYTVTGWKYDDSSLSGSLARDAGINVGSYIIRQGTLADTSGNYTVHFVEAVLKITKATLTVIADHLSKVFGSADPVFTFTVIGWQFDDEMNEEKILSGALIREQGENVNSYAVNQGTLADISGNYAIIFVPADMDITALSVDDTSIDVTVEKRHEYTGKPIEPIPAVKLGNTILTEGIDYEISYTDNISVGMSASMTITFKGNYSGSVEIKFEIYSDSFFITGTVFDSKYDKELADAEIEYEVNGVIRPIMVTGSDGTYTISEIPLSAEVRIISVFLHGYIYKTLPQFEPVTASVHDADIFLAYDGISTFSVTVKADEGSVIEFTFDNWNTFESFTVGPSGRYIIDKIPYETLIEKRAQGGSATIWEADAGDVTEGEFALLVIRNSGVSVTLLPTEQTEESCLLWYILLILSLALLFKLVWSSRTPSERKSKHK